MNVSHRNQAGFGAIEALLILVILSLVGFTGYYVWHATNGADKNFASAARTSVATLPKKTSTPAAEARYLHIQEWGVKIDVGPGNDADKMSYTIGNPVNNGTQTIESAYVHFSIPALKNDTVNLLRSQQNMNDEFDKDRQTHIGNYWYAYKASGDESSLGRVTVNEWKIVAE